MPTDYINNREVLRILVVLALATSMPGAYAQADVSGIYLDSSHSGHHEKKVDRNLAFSHLGRGEGLVAKHEYDKAWEQFALAVEIMRKSPDATKHNIASMYKRCAVYMIDADEFTRADAYLTNAVAMLDKDAHEKLPCPLEMECLAYHLKCYLLSRRYQEAVPVFRKGLEMFRVTWAHSPDGMGDVTEVQFFGDCAHDIGIAFYKDGKNSEAIKFLKEAIKLRETVVKSATATGKYSTARTEPRRDLATSLCALGRVLMATQDKKGAADCFVKAYTLRKTLGLPVYLWSSADLDNAIETFQKTTGQSVPNVNVNTSYRDLFKDENFFPTTWSMDLQSAERLDRERAWKFWVNDNRKKLHQQILAEAKTFGEGSHQWIVSNIQMALYKLNSGYNEEAALPYIKESVKALATVRSAVAPAVIADFDKKVKSESYQRELTLAEIEMFESTDPDSPTLNYLYKTLLHCLQHEPSAGRDVAKYLDRIEKRVGAEDPLLIGVLPYLAKYYRAQSQFHEAALVYKRLVDYMKQHHGAKSRETKDALHKYAVYLRLDRDHESAARAESEANAIQHSSAEN